MNLRITIYDENMVTLGYQIVSSDYVHPIYPLLKNKNVQSFKVTKEDNL